MAFDYSGGNSVIGLVEEVTWGTAVSPRTVFRPVVSSNLGRTKEKGNRANLGVGTLSNIPNDEFTIRDDAGGRIEVEATYDNLGILLKHAMGQVATTGPVGSDYTHTYSRQAESSWPEGLTLAENRGTASREVYEGMRIARWGFRCATGEQMIFFFEFIGETSDSRTDTQDTATFGAAETIILHFHAGELFWNSTSYCVDSISVEVDNGFDRRVCLGQTVTQKPIIRRRQSVVLDAVLDVKDVLHDDYLNEVKDDVSMTFSDPDSNRSFNFAISNARITSLSDPLNNFDIVKQNVRFTGFSDGSTTLTEQGIQLIVMNENASAIAN